MHSRRNKQRLRLLSVFSFSFVIIFLILTLLSISLSSLVHTKLDFPTFIIVLAIPNVPPNITTLTPTPTDKIPAIPNQTISGNATTITAAPSNQTKGGGSDEYVFVKGWGSEGTEDGQFAALLGIAVDSSDNVYAIDFEHRRIQKFDSDGNFITKWGSNGTGDGQFVNPNGVGVDSSGNVYVADSGNDRIQVFAPSS